MQISIKEFSFYDENNYPNRADHADRIMELIELMKMT